MTKNNASWTSVIASILAHVVIFFFFSVVFMTSRPNRDLHKGGGTRISINTDLQETDDSLSRLENVELKPISEEKPVDLASQSVNATIKPVRVEVASLLPRNGIASLRLDPSGSLSGGLKPFTRIDGMVTGSGTKAPFAGRIGDAKKLLIKSEGGTKESESAVSLGLKWLAAHQMRDGSWTFACHLGCKKPPGCPPGEFFHADAAATGLALLCFLGSGYTHHADSQYKLNVDRGIKWLADHQAANGNFHTSGTPMHLMYSHAIATMAMCEAYGLTRDRRLKPHAQKAVQFIVAAQHAGGGWRYAVKMPGDTSVLGWQMIALRSALFAELPVPSSTLLGIQNYLNSASAGDDTPFYTYRPGRTPSMVMTAEALLCRQILGWDNSHPMIKAGSQAVITDVLEKTDRNIYYWYYAAQFLHNENGQSWKTFNPVVRDHLVKSQDTTKTCSEGSWDPMFIDPRRNQLPSPDAWGKDAGRLYQTTLSILTLEVYYRYPVFQLDDF